MKKIKKNTIIVVKDGRFKGEEFRLEANIEDMDERIHSDLPTLASRGNWAAINAINIDKYKYEDAPFFYGKIGSLGYIISGKDLGI